MEILEAQGSSLIDSPLPLSNASRSLIINADDLGISPGVDNAIFSLYKEGCISSASMLVNMSGSERAAAELKSNPGFPVGVHLNLGHGRKMSDGHGLQAILDRDGRFTGDRRFLKAYFTGRLKMSGIEKEFCSQVEEFYRLAERPSHIDTHMYLHAFPGIMRIVLRVAEHFGINAIRNPYETVSPALRKSLSQKRIFSFQMVKSSMLRMQSRSALKLLENSGRAFPDRFHGVLQMGSGTFEKVFSAVAEALQPGKTAELMCHPGFPDDLLKETTWYAVERLNEFEALRSPVFHEALLANNVKLMSFRDI